MLRQALIDRGYDAIEDIFDQDSGFTNKPIILLDTSEMIKLGEKHHLTSQLFFESLKDSLFR